MKSVLYLIRRRPGLPADETVDLILVSGVFEQPTSVLFMDDGVYQLVALDRRQSSIKALPTYAIDELYVAEHSLASRGLSATDIDLDIKLTDHNGIHELIAAHDLVLTD